MAGAAVDRPECAEQAVPGGAGALQGVFANVAGMLSQLSREGADGVAVRVGVVVDGEQSAFFGVEQEHQAHQDGDCALVHLGRFDRSRQQGLAVLCLVVGIESSNARHQHLYDCPRLFGEPGGDLLLAVHAGGEQRG